MNNFKKIKLDYLFILILLSAFAVRLVNINRQSLTVDELHSIETIQNNPLFKKNIDIHPPLFYNILHIWSLIFGKTYFSLRFFSLLLSIVQIFILNKISKLLSFDDLPRYLLLFLFSFSTYHIYYSIDIKSYMLYLTFVLLNLYLILTDEIFETKNLFLFTLFSLLGLYTHNTYFVFYITSLIYLFFKILKKKQYSLILKLGIFQLIAFFLYIPQVINIFTSQINVLIERNQVLNFSIDFYIRYFGLFFEFSNFFIFIFIIYFMLFVFALISKKKSFFRINVFFLLIIPLLLSYLLDITDISRHMIYLFPFFYIGIVEGVCLFKNKNLQVILAIVLIAINLFSIFYFQTHFIKPPIYESVKLMETEEMKIVCFEKYEYNCLLIESHDINHDLDDRLIKLDVPRPELIKESFKNSEYKDIEEYKRKFILDNISNEINNITKPYILFGGYKDLDVFISSLIKSQNLSVKKIYNIGSMYENKKIFWSLDNTNIPFLHDPKIYIIN